MQTSTNDDSPVRSTDRRLEDLIRLLAEEGRAARTEARRERRRARVMIGVLALLLMAMGWSALSTRTLAQAEILAHGQPPAVGADERAARRAELLAMLPGDAAGR